MNNRYILIMAGGVGSRFWPLSRIEKPKQFLDILGSGETLIQQTFRRFKSVCPEENIYVVTSIDHKELVINQLGVSPTKVLTEPFRKNTAPCIAYGTFMVMKENPDAIIAVTPADHLILNEEEFQNTINRGFNFANTHNVLITLGIRPEKPDTGYGYIQADNKNKVNGIDNLFKVKAFREKPDINLAESFVKSGDFYWNSGIFIWNSKSIVEAMVRYLPDITQPFIKNAGLLGTERETDFITDAYSTFKSISIDYGVLEKAENVYVLCTDMGWSDLGTWGSLFVHSKTDNENNAVVRGKAYSHNCNDNLISITPGKVALIQGLHDFIVVDTPGSLLIIRKDDEQNIKQYLEQIKNKGIDI